MREHYHGRRQMLNKNAHASLAPSVGFAQPRLVEAFRLVAGARRWRVLRGR